ncbi:MAG: aminoacyl-tRNA hydrolase [Clostridia bacterium]
MIIVGLGNFGSQYENTRHNIGFMVISQVAEKFQQVFKKKDCKSLVCECFVNGTKHILAKPQTYMNLSGEAVREFVTKYKTPIEQVLVISDDLDLPLGSIRIRKNGGAGTHNGLRNIVLETNSKDFIRVRVGIGEKPNPNLDLADFVLSKFTKTEMEVVQVGLDRATDAITELMEGKSIDIVMGKYNTSNK